LKPIYKYILSLLVFEFLVSLAGLLLISISSIDIHFTDIAILSAGFTIISLITLIIFFRGQNKEPASQTMHTLVSLSLKFLIELVLAVAWFFISKKSGLSSVILFFVLYLSFTLFLVTIMLKTVNPKSL